LNNPDGAGLLSAKPPGGTGAVSLQLNHNHGDLRSKALTGLETSEIIRVTSENWENMMFTNTEILGNESLPNCSDRYKRSTQVIRKRAVPNRPLLNIFWIM